MDPIPVGEVLAAVESRTATRYQQQLVRNQYDRPVHEPHVNDGDDHSDLFPLALLQTAARQRARSPADNAYLLRHVMAYAVDSRGRFLTMDPATVQHQLKLHLPIDDYGVVVAEARRVVSDYQVEYFDMTGKTATPFARVHWNVLVDAYNAVQRSDLQLRDFLVYCAVTSRMQVRVKGAWTFRPVCMTVATILRRMSGFHNADMFNAAVRSERFRLVYDRNSVRKAVRSLVKRGMLYKATRGRETYYATLATLHAAGIHNLHGWVRAKQEGQLNRWTRTMRLDREYSAAAGDPVTAAVDQVVPAKTAVGRVSGPVRIQCDRCSHVHGPNEDCHGSRPEPPSPAVPHARKGGTLMECGGCGKPHLTSEPCPV